MPIEIKELHIKINVDDKPQVVNSKVMKQDEKDRIIAACVEQIMEILAKKHER